MKATRTQIAQLVVDCENTLGWQPPAGEPISKARVRVTNAISKQLQDNPDLTLVDLQLAVELLREKRITLYSPVGLIKFVPEARERGASTDVQTSLDEQITDAKRWENEHELPGYDDWLTRLIRARGDYRMDVLTTWRADRAKALARNPIRASTWP